MKHNVAKGDITWAQEVLSIEKQALEDFSQRLGNEFITTLGIIEYRIPSGEVIVPGMGKPGHISNKSVATLTSIETPEFFVHPGEAGEGAWVD